MGLGKNGEGIKEKTKALAQLVGASTHKPEGQGFDSWSEHMPRLWVWFSAGACVRGSCSMFLSLSLSASPLYRTINMSLGEDKK